MSVGPTTLVPMTPVLTGVALSVVLLLVGLALGAVLGATWVRRGAGRGPDGRDLPQLLDALDQRTRGEAVLSDRLSEGLARLGDQMRDLEQGRSVWEGRFAAQVAEMHRSAESLRRETRTLSTALRRPQVRGRWGEMHLRRAVELAGLVDRCDFAEQVHLAGEAGQLRPDLVVHLAGGRSVVVDAKVPLEAFLDATAAVEESLDDAAQVEEERLAHLRRHARQVRTHVEQLAARRYWRALPASPEFVVLFVPGEAFLSAALEVDPDLIDHAAGQRVVLATPTTLIALLRTVALGWSQATLADQAREVADLGRELHERLDTLGGHLDQVGRSLGAAVAGYNSAVGSYESRVLVSARRFRDLGVVDDEVRTPRQVDAACRVRGA